MAQLLEEFEKTIESITLVPSDGGRFEVIVNEKELYSKLKTNRHAQPGEVLGLVREFLQEAE